MALKKQWPEVLEITGDDLTEVLGLGLKDFRAAPKFGLFFSGLYVLAGWLLMALIWHFEMPYLAYPLAMGFALVAPFAAGGYYAISDLLAKGEELSWSKVFGSLRNALKRDLRWMAVVTGFALVLWMDIAAFLTFAFGVNSFDANPLDTLFTTPSGLLFLALGNIAGALIAFGVFAISAISFPMLYDRDVDFVTAMVTSVHLVMANPWSMLGWCVFIGLAMGVSILSGFIALLFLLPIIGHATWHLYKRAVAPADTDRRLAELPKLSSAGSAKPVGA